MVPQKFLRMIANFLIANVHLKVFTFVNSNYSTFEKRIGKSYLTGQSQQIIALLTGQFHQIIDSLTGLSRQIFFYLTGPYN